MRNPDICDDSPSCVAAHKAQAALRLGCTHFVESDPIQAIEIARNAPLLHVIWWNASAGEGRLVMSDDWRGTRKSSNNNLSGGKPTTKVLNVSVAVLLDVADVGRG
jgi:hypothetical protein